VSTDSFIHLPVCRPAKKIRCPPSDNDCGSRYKNRPEFDIHGSIKPNENPNSQTMQSNAANLQQAYRTMKIDFIEQENRCHELERSSRPETNQGWMNAFLILAFKKFLSTFNAHLPAAISRETFIWLPFAGGMSAFAVILPKPRE
jgi:hypothetical protein